MRSPSRRTHQTKSDYQKELFVHAVSTQSVTLDAVGVPSIGGTLAYDAVKLAPFVLGVSSLVSVKMPAKTDAYSARLGALYAATIYLKQDVGGSGQKFISELGFFTRTQDTSLTRQTQTDLILRVHYFFPVGRREKEGER